MGYFMAIDLREVGSGEKRTSLNENFNIIENAINDSLLWRDGNQPMAGSLDMDSERIINLPDAVTDQEPATYGQLLSAVLGEGVGTASVVVDSFALAVTSDTTDEVIITKGYYASTPGIGSSMYVKTDITGTVGQTDGGSYFIGVDGFRWELLHSGTVMLEQFGAQEDTAMGDIPRAISALTSVSKITTNLSKLVFDKTWPVNRSDIEIDFNGADIDWTGVYNIYYDDYGLGVPGDNLGIGDRTVGVIGFRAVPADTDIKTVSSSIVDGTNKLTLDSVTGLAVDDYVHLSIEYPLRSETQIARITDISGSDVTINYAFGWVVTSCTLQKIDLYENVKVKNVGKFNDLAIYEDTVDSAAWAACAIATRGCANVEIDGIETNNTNMPSVMVYECTEVKASNILCKNPRNTTPGRGYSFQIIKSSFFEVDNIGGWYNRHTFDSSGGSYGKISRCYAVKDGNDAAYTFTTHGQYEHDLVYKDCYDIGARLSMAGARSGIAFGASNKRYSVENCHFSGLVQVENVDDLVVRDTDLTGVDPVNRHRVGVRGSVIFENVKFNPASLLLISRHNDISGAITPDFGRIVFRDCELPNDMRHHFHEGDYLFENCTGFTEFDFTSAGGDDPVSVWPRTITVRSCDMSVDTTMNFRVQDKLLFDRVNFNVLATPAAMFAYDTAGEVEFFNCSASASSDITIFCRAPITKVDGGEWSNVGVRAEYNVTAGIVPVRYELSNIYSSCDGGIWRADGTDGIAASAKGCTFTGTGGLKLQGDAMTNTSWRLSNVYSEYDMKTSLSTGVVSLEHSGCSSPTLGEYYSGGIEEISTSDTLDIGDIGRWFVDTSTGTNTLTIPAGLPVGFSFSVLKDADSGTLTAVETGPEVLTGSSGIVSGTATLVNRTTKKFTKITSTNWYVEQYT